MQLRLRYKFKHYPSKDEYITEYYYEDHKEAMACEDGLKDFLIKHHYFSDGGGLIDWEEVYEQR